MPNEFIELITVDDLAKTLAVPKSWIYSKTRETGPNAIPKVKVGKYCRFVFSDVMEWLMNRQDGE